MIAVVMPNDQTVDFDWSKYRVSVRRVEKLTGYNFFPAVPAEVAAALKGRVDEVEVRVPRPRAALRSASTAGCFFTANPPR